MSKDKASTAMTHVKLVNRSDIPLWGPLDFYAQETEWQSVVYYVRAAHASSAGIKCRHSVSFVWQLWFLATNSHLH